MFVYSFGTQNTITSDAYMKAGLHVYAETYVSRSDKTAAKKLGGINLMLCSLLPRHIMLMRYSPHEVDSMWLWVYYNKIPIYPIFYLST